MNAIVLGDFLGSDVFSWYHLSRIAARLPYEIDVKSDFSVQKNHKSAFLPVFGRSKGSKGGLVYMLSTRSPKVVAMLPPASFIP